jgi:hypothetical protein
MKNPLETKQYLVYYGLREAPYSTNPDERLLYLTDQHQDAIAMVGHIVENKEGAGLIVGKHLGDLQNRSTSVKLISQVYEPCRKALLSALTLVYNR